MVGARRQHRAAQGDDAGDQVGPAYGEAAGQHAAEAVPDDAGPGVPRRMRDRLEPGLELGGGVERAADVGVDVGAVGAEALRAQRRAPSAARLPSPAMKPGTRTHRVAVARRRAGRRTAPAPAVRGARGADGVAAGLARRRCPRAAPPRGRGGVEALGAQEVGQRWAGHERRRSDARIRRLSAVRAGGVVRPCRVRSMRLTGAHGRAAPSPASPDAVRDVRRVRASCSPRSVPASSSATRPSATPTTSRCCW